MTETLQQKIEALTTGEEYLLDKYQVNKAIQELRENISDKFQQFRWSNRTTQEFEAFERDVLALIGEKK